MSTQIPIPNALVIVIREDKRFAFYGYTDENGKISIRLPAGKYDIFVIKDEYFYHYQLEVIDVNKTKTIQLKKFPPKLAFVPYVEYILQYFEETKESFFKAIKLHPELTFQYPNLLDLASYIRSIYFGITVIAFDDLLKFPNKAVLVANANVYLDPRPFTFLAMLQKIPRKIPLSATANIYIDPRPFSFLNVIRKFPSKMSLSATASVNVYATVS